MHHDETNFAKTDSQSNLIEIVFVLLALYSLIKLRHTLQISVIKECAGNTLFSISFLCCIKKQMLIKIFNLLIH